MAHAAWHGRCLLGTPRPAEATWQWHHARLAAPLVITLIGGHRNALPFDADMAAHVQRLSVIYYSVTGDIQHDIDEAKTFIFHAHPALKRKRPAAAMAGDAAASNNGSNFRPINTTPRQALSAN